MGLFSQFSPRPAHHAGKAIQLQTVMLLVHDRATNLGMVGQTDYTSKEFSEKPARKERSWLYGEVYSKLFDSLPDHPQKTSSGLPAKRVADRKRLLGPLLKPDAVYLEVGCGSAALPFAIASLAAEVLGLDVTDTLLREDRRRGNPTGRQFRRSRSFGSVHRARVSTCGSTTIARCETCS
jgi:hypothetical protein